MIELSYDGRYPNLCAGVLVAVIDGKRWEFPRHFLQSTGGTNWQEDKVWDGPWEFREDEWPEGFPENLKPLVRETVNQEIRHGCCGGCI